MTGMVTVQSYRFPEETREQVRNNLSTACEREGVPTAQIEPVRSVRHVSGQLQSDDRLLVVALRVIPDTSDSQRPPSGSSSTTRAITTLWLGKSSEQHLLAARRPRPGRRLPEWAQGASLARGGLSCASDNRNPRLGKSNTFSTLPAGDVGGRWIGLVPSDS